MKHVVMFSSGAGSAIAGKLVADRYGTEDLTLLFADVNMEHPDNYRFLREAAEWIGAPLVILDNGGKTIWDVFRDVNFLGNSRVDPCSRVLKREPMRKWLEDNRDPADTVAYLGFDWTEQHRIDRAQRYWEPWKMEAPMCWEGAVLDKAEGIQRMRDAGIEAPLLTRQGFPHANCGGGCVKAGIKQFKKMLEVNPDTYKDWEDNEQAIRTHLGKDVSILTDRRNKSKVPMTLTTLRKRIEVEDASSFADEDWGGCNCFTPIEGADDDPQ